MKSTKSFLSLIVALAACLLARPASALPASCYQYTAYDGFDTPSFWSPWNDSVSGTILTGPAPGYGALSGNTADVFTFPHSEPNGGFLLTDRTVNSTTSIDHNLTTRFPSRGCPHDIPFNPSSRLLYCSATVWIKPLGGANGFFQLLGTDYTYLATASFNLAASTAWTEITVPGNVSCQDTMIVRLGINRTSTSSASMVADDIDITWAY
jgi:hypothetical protein